MLSEPRCSICADPTAKVAVAELISKGGTVRGIASRLKIAKSNVGRHVAHAGLKKDGISTERGSRGRASQAGHVIAGGRCPTCGLHVDGVDPEALIRRAERSLHFGEEIVMRAVQERDDRTGLQGLDRVRTALELLLRVHGRLVPDSASTYIDARRQQVAILGELTTDELRTLIAGATLEGGRGTIAVPSETTPLGKPKLSGASRNDVPE